MKNITKCPLCKKEIEGVIEDRLQHAYYDVWWNDNKEIDDNYQHRDYGDAISSKYYCPECDSLIAKNDDELTKKLNIKL